MLVSPLPGQCPSCAEPLTSRELAGVAYEECDRCEGTFLTHAAIDALLTAAPKQSLCTARASLGRAFDRKRAVQCARM